MNIIVLIVGVNIMVDMVNMVDVVDMVDVVNMVDVLGVLVMVMSAVGRRVERSPR